MHLAALTAAALLMAPRPAPESLLPAAVPAALPALIPTPAPTPRAPAPVDAERVVVTTEDKLSLAGTYWPPTKSKQISPGAVLIHDAGGKRADVADYAERLSRLGFAVLTVDLRGHGESAGADLDWSKLDQEGRERLWAFATRDVKACADFLRSQRDVHSASLVLIGYGAGTALVTRHAVRDENVRSIVLLSPPTEPERMLGFHLERDLEALGGLPTLVSVPRDRKQATEELAARSHAANGGLEYIEVSTFKGADADVLSDAREAASVAKWLKVRASPGKGAR